MLRLVPLLAVMLCAGCVGEVSDLDPASDALRAVKTVPLSATDRLATMSSVTSGAGARTAGVFEGRAAIGTASGLLASNTNSVDALAPVQGLGEDGGTREIGEVTFVARRGATGTLVISSEGLFHDRTGVLLESPLNAAIRDRGPITVDSFGAGSSEELWLIAAEGALHVSDGRLRSVKIRGVDAMPDAVLAIGAGRALLAIDGSLYEIDLGANTAVRIAKELGVLRSCERSEDGNAYFATSKGLLEVTKAGELRLHTFAPEGEPARSVISVAAAAGLVVAGTESELYSIESDGTVRIGSEAGVLPRGLLIDGAGDTFAATTTSLHRFKTGRPASFEADVKPFFSAHCMSCHRTGVSGARAIDFEDYVTAKGIAPTALNRLNAVGISPMPPANIETLSAADYAVVTRWVSGGMAP